MTTNKRLAGIQKLAAIALLGTVLAGPFGSCNLGEFTTTSTVTLSGREVVSFLVRSALLTPIETAVDRGIEAFFDRLDDEEDD